MLHGTLIVFAFRIRTDCRAAAARRGLNGGTHDDVRSNPEVHVTSATTVATTGPAPGGEEAKGAVVLDGVTKRYVPAPAVDRS